MANALAAIVVDKTSAFANQKIANFQRQISLDEQQIAIITRSLQGGGLSETEILIAYGGVRFASKVGQLAGNHFMTITEGREHLRALGEHVLWQGAQDILFQAIS